MAAARPIAVGERLLVEEDPEVGKGLEHFLGLEPELG